MSEQHGKKGKRGRHGDDDDPDTEEALGVQKKLKKKLKKKWCRIENTIPVRFFQGFT